MSSTPDDKDKKALASARAKVAMAENEIVFRKEQVGKALEERDKVKAELAALEAKQEALERATDEALRDLRPMEQPDGDLASDRPQSLEPDPKLGGNQKGRRRRRDP
jgi:hypothetical protein